MTVSGALSETDDGRSVRVPLPDSPAGLSPVGAPATVGSVLALRCVVQGDGETP